MNKKLLAILLFPLFLLFGLAVNLPAGNSASITARATVANPIGFTQDYIDPITSDGTDRIVIPGITVPHRGSIRCEARLGRFIVKEVTLYHQGYLQNIYLENMTPPDDKEFSDTLFINIIYFENR